MPMEYVNRLMAKVEIKTGYPVTVINDDKLPSNSGMKAASAELPSHIVMLNPKYERGANYLIAVQCLMLMMKQVSENEVCEFTVLSEKFEYLVDKAVKQMAKVNIPPDVKSGYAQRIVRGLLQQLNSLPCEIMAIQEIHRDAPDLRAEMEYIPNSELQVNFDSLSPDISAIAPKDIFAKNTAMNAAFAIICGEVLGNPGIVQPYKVSGVIDEGHKLAALIRNPTSPGGNLYQKTVDSWAEHLKMKTMYNWTVREK